PDHRSGRDRRPRPGPRREQRHDRAGARRPRHPRPPDRRPRGALRARARRPPGDAHRPRRAAYDLAATRRLDHAVVGRRTDRAVRGPDRHQPAAALLLGRLPVAVTRRPTALLAAAVLAVLLAVLAGCSSGDPRTEPTGPITSPADVPSTAGAPGI